MLDTSAAPKMFCIGSITLRCSVPFVLPIRTISPSSPFRSRMERAITKKSRYVLPERVAPCFMFHR